MGLRCWVQIESVRNGRLFSVEQLLAVWYCWKMLCSFMSYLVLRSSSGFWEKEKQKKKIFSSRSFSGKVNRFSGEIFQLCFLLCNILGDRERGEKWEQTFANHIQLFDVVSVCQIRCLWDYMRDEFIRKLAGTTAFTRDWKAERSSGRVTSPACSTRIYHNRRLMPKDKITRPKGAPKKKMAQFKGTIKGTIETWNIIS